ALEYFGIDRRQALVVEDSARGLRSAVAAGIDCAVVYHPFTAPQDFSQATYRINSLAELEQLIQ
ncbi:MAG: beta-phosphoglucomutase-like phosphatase (HAD superfamily), partial [Candidatus Azotimanducaceae bacterium]